MTDEHIAQYVVVGAGAAGCVVAERLSRDPRVSVVVLEAGGSDNRVELRVPVGAFRVLGNPKYDWCYETSPDPSRRGRKEMWHRGRVVGGSGAINGLFFVRGSPGDFDGWVKAAGDGWDYADVLPYFRELESYPQGEPSHRGAAGPFRVTDVVTPHWLCEIFLTAAQEVGIPRTPDYNGRQYAGACIAQTSVRNGWRETSYRAFLRPALRRPNLRLITNARARRLVIKDGRVTGVEYIRGSRQAKLLAGRETIVCAGAIGSPHLLLSSGIGPAPELQGLGIRVAANLEGVGRNLQEHAGIWIVNALRDGIRTVNMDATLGGFLRHGIRFLATRSGPAASPTAQALAFVGTEPELRDPDVQIHFMPLGYRITHSGFEPLSTPAMMAVPNVSRPKSRGVVRLASADPDILPLIEPRLLEDEDDVRRLVRACRLVRKIFSAPAFAPYNAGESFPGPSVQTDEEWTEVLRQHVGPVYHIAGTCRMGTDRAAVVDSRLRVKGIRDLRVIDASIMPSITSGNTHAPTLMIAAKGADMVLADIANAR